MGKQTTSTATVTTPLDPYARITSRILADIEQGVRPWVKPWTCGAGNGRVTAAVAGAETLSARLRKLSGIMLVLLVARLGWRSYNPSECL